MIVTAEMKIFGYAPVATANVHALNTCVADPVLPSETPRTRTPARTVGKGSSCDIHLQGSTPVSDSRTSAATATTSDISPRQVRSHLLGAGRGRRLIAPELVEVGRALYGEPGLLSLYGVPAERMEARWLHVLGCTAAECTIDPVCAGVVAAVADLVAGCRGPRRVVDLFAGSANIAYHLSQGPNVVCHASDVDPRVYRATRHNLGLLGAPVHLHNADYRDLLGMLPPWGQNDVYIVDPPWRYGRPGSETMSAPSLQTIVDNIRRSRGGMPFVLVTTQDAVGKDARRGLAAANLARSVSLPSTMPSTTPRGHGVQLHVYACQAAVQERLAG